MKKKSRLPFLGTALAITLVAAWFAPDVEVNPLVVAPSKPVTRAASTASDSLRQNIPEVLEIKQRPTVDAVAYTFAPATWQSPKPQPRPKKVEAPPPPAPVAPPLPFRFMGRYEADGSTAVFLLHKDQTLVVREGDAVAEDYRLLSISGTQISFMYLPLEQEQVLNTKLVDTK